MLVSRYLPTLSADTVVEVLLPPVIGGDRIPEFQVWEPGNHFNTHQTVRSIDGRTFGLLGSRLAGAAVDQRIEAQVRVIEAICLAEVPAEVVGFTGLGRMTSEAAEALELMDEETSLAWYRAALAGAEDAAGRATLEAADAALLRQARG